ncbi:EamA family transporter [Oceanospirillaceae bacterium]|jgi:O-acetylserine/cysteine efflux transporter|nr:EamA family transporter [Oceanospirillaceae bacterium]|tara:strand:+ start:57 stop:932 length:876 start_codon:yes stop_codon:yes gene_type:complete
MKPLDTLSAISVAIIWGMGFVIAKAAMEHFSPILLMALRFTLTALCMIWFFRPDPKLFNKLFWIAFVSAAIQYSLTFTGVSGIDASTAALLIQLEVPFAILLAAVVLGDKLTIRQGVGVSLAFCGAILIVGEPKLANNMRYVLMVIGGGFAWSLGQIMIKMMGVSGGFSLISSVAVFAAPQLFIASYLLEDNQIDQIITASPAAWAAVVYLGLVMTALGYAMWYRLLGLYDVNMVMPFLLLLPVASVVGGYLFLDEILTTKIAIGGLLALAGVAIITLRIKQSTPIEDANS